MVNPDGQERCFIQKFTSISPKTIFKTFNTFADKDENPGLPGSGWGLSFSEQNGITKVNITIYNESRELSEKIVECIREGMTPGLTQLDELLLKLKGR